MPDPFAIVPTLGALADGWPTATRPAYQRRKARVRRAMRRGSAGSRPIRARRPAAARPDAAATRSKAARRHAASAGTEPAARSRAASPATAKPSDTAGLRSGRASAWGRRGARVHEQPLVVAPRLGLHPGSQRSRARVDADRHLTALAHDAVQTAAGGWKRTGRRRRLHAAPSPGRTAGGIDAREQQLELAILAHRVLVLLPEEPLIDEDVDARRPRPGAVAALPEADGAHVLLTPEDELRFLLALRLVAPGRQDRAHQHGHHGQGDEQGRHRIATLAVLTP